MRLGNRHVTVADQVVSSASNFLLVAVVARTSSVTAFGTFSLAYVVVVFVLGLERALLGEVLLVRWSTREVDDATVRQVLGAGLLLGLAGTIGMATVELLAGRDGAVWAVLGLALPAALVQDVARYVLISRRQSQRALLLDLVWCGLGVALMVVAAWSGAGSLWVVAAWIAGAVASGLLGLRVLHAWPAPASSLAWVRANADLSARFGAEYASLNASTALVWFFLAVPLNTSGVAAIRGAALLFSPLNAGFNAIRVAVIPDLVRSFGSRVYRRRLAEAGGVLAALGLVWGGVALLLPQSIGRQLLGSTWTSAADLRGAAFAQALAMVVYTVLLAHFRASAAGRRSSQMRGLLAVLTLAMPLVLALHWGAAGAAWGFAAAVTASALAGGALSWRDGRPWGRQELA